MESDLIYRDVSYTINGILFEVHNELGRYRNELQYADAIEGRLKERGISYERERVLDPAFASERPGRNRVDFLIADAIIIEVKSKSIISREDYYQTLRYLVALNCKLGILVNFRQRLLTPKRVINPKAPVRRIRVSASSA
ncbi:GxxExxY protein [Candidatus Uhrbacteria bacterium]|nr:GxxExxY protein [Candidatus Uhrbacteria bacterium]